MKPEVLPSRRHLDHVLFILNLFQYLPFHFVRSNYFVTLQSASNFSTRTWYASFITSLLTLHHYYYLFPPPFCEARIWCCLPVPMFGSFKTVILFSSRPTSLLLLALRRFRNVHYLLSWLQFPCFFQFNWYYITSLPFSQYALRHCIFSKHSSLIVEE